MRVGLSCMVLLLVVVVVVLGVVVGGAAAPSGDIRAARPVQRDERAVARGDAPFLLEGTHYDRLRVGMSRLAGVEHVVKVVRATKVKHNWEDGRVPKCPVPCELETNVNSGVYRSPGDLEQRRGADALFFSIPNLLRNYVSEEPLYIADGRRRTEWQQWQFFRESDKLPRVGFSMESDVHYDLMQNEEAMRVFDITMSFRWTSTVPVPYWSIHSLPRLMRAPRPREQKNGLVAWFCSRDESHNDRTALVGELMRYIQVDSYGSVLQNRPTPRDAHGQLQSKYDVLRGYTFTLALENANSVDYVTEKVYDALDAGSIPVYLGAPNVLEFVPHPDAVILVSDFDSPRDLAAYLVQVASDDALYAKHMRWKETGPTREFLDRFAFTEWSAECRLCAHLAARRVAHDSWQRTRPRHRHVPRGSHHEL